jgi:hypothetical protein
VLAVSPAGVKMISYADDSVRPFSSTVTVLPATSRSFSPISRGGAESPIWPVHGISRIQACTLDPKTFAGTLVNRT